MKNLLKQLGYNVISDENTLMMPEWLAWYKGYIQNVHDYKVYNGKKHITQKRAQLRMGKKVCEDWANMLLNEKVSITVGTENLTQHIHSILDNNQFRKRANQLIELTFAMGTGAFVEFKEGDKVNIDYVTADKIYPLSCDNGEITECAFTSIKIIDGKKHYYINVHKKNEKGCYVVENYLFDKNKKRCDLPNGVIDVIETKSNIPLYQIIKPNITSNTCIDAVMGMSVLANSLDVLKSIDIIFDSYINEFVLGKKRIMIPMSMAQFTDTEGEIRPVFDANDVAFYGIEDNETNGIKEIDMNLRATEHDAALEQNLNLLSEKCGFGAGHYKYDRNYGVKTATEVVSEKSDLFRNLKKHELVLSSAIQGMVYAIMTLEGMSAENIDVEIDFDDSIIEDRKAEFSERSQLVNLGVMSPVEMRMWYLNETEEQSTQAIEKMQAIISEE